jgi:hypothetical protein
MGTIDHIVSAIRDSDLSTQGMTRRSTGRSKEPSLRPLGAQEIFARHIGQYAPDELTDPCHRRRQIIGVMRPGADRFWRVDLLRAMHACFV